MTEPGSVTTLIEQLKAGNRDAAERLWQRYYARLVGLARKRLRSLPRRAADEEDVALSALDSFCRGAEAGRFPRLTDRDGLWELLVVITARKAADLANHQRRQKRGGGQVRGDSVAAGGSSAGPGMDAFPDDDPTPALAAQLAEEFERLLDRLKHHAELRQIALRKLEGYTNAEVAAELGCAEPTVERRLKLIRQILRG